MTARILLGCVTTPKDRAAAERVHESIRALSPQPAAVIFAEASGDSAYSEWLTKAGWRVISADAADAASKHAAARDAIARHALREGYTHVLFMEGGIVLPSSALEYLCEDPQPVVGGVYLGPAEVGGRLLIAPVLAAVHESEPYGRLVPLNLVMEDKRLIVGGIGFGCAMIATKVLESVDLKKHRTPFEACDAMRAAGFTVFADTRVKCVHVYAGKDLVFPVSLTAFSFETDA